MEASLDQLRLWLNAGFAVLESAPLTDIHKLPFITIVLDLLGKTSLAQKLPVPYLLPFVVRTVLVTGAIPYKTWDISMSGS